MTSLILASALTASSAALLYASYRMTVRGRLPGEVVLVLALGGTLGAYAVIMWGSVIWSAVTG